jgi:hypothetical protein
MDCENSPLMHKHHIIPRYMGGTDDPTNLVEVTVTQHAMFHFCNYQLWGNEQDKIAYRGLSGSIGKEEVIMELMTLAVNMARTPENIEKKKQTLKEIKHQQGEKNSQYGKMWITDGTKEGSYRINKGDPIPEGFRKGRVSRSEESIKYTYVITTPEGEIIRTKYLDDFCRRNNLVDSVMYRVAAGKRSNHRGFKVHKELDKPPTNML